MPVMRGQFQFCLIIIKEKESSVVVALFFVFCYGTFLRDDCVVGNCQFASF